MDPVIGIVTATRRAGTSRMGNPAYDVCVAHEYDTEILTTAANSSLAYEIRNACFTKRPHTFFLNARGKITWAKHHEECHQGS